MMPFRQRKAVIGAMHFVKTQCKMEVALIVFPGGDVEIHILLVHNGKLVSFVEW